MSGRINTYRLTLALALSACFLQAFGGGEKTDRQKYIEQWSSVAVEHMHTYGIPASITLAQGILESGNGKSMLTQEANNHFGIKCHGWKGPGVYKDDDKRNECFRKYKQAEDSFEDHAEFLKRKRYQFLYNYKSTDYKAWAKGLKKAGYATDPAYAKRLISLIETNDLDRFDRLEMADIGSVTSRKTKQSGEPRFRDERIVNPVDRELIDLTSQYDVRLHPNSIRYVLARSGATLEEVAQAMDLAPWQLKRYNDLPSGYRFKGGETIFVQPKRNRSKTKYHQSLEGETLRVISQRYGVKLKRLLSYNRGVDKDKSLNKGTKVYLKRPPT